MAADLFSGYTPMPSPAASSFQPLTGVRVLSLALNLPGPAALLRCRGMGATCVKLEPPGGDPMAHYNKTAYAALHEGVAVRAADLKTEAGQEQLHAELAQTDVLLTSFRPSALAKLRLDWASLQERHPTVLLELRDPLARRRQRVPESIRAGRQAAGVHGGDVEPQRDEVESVEVDHGLEPRI